MKEKFKQIWELAWPYQDKRDDSGHAEVTVHYAEILVGLENGNEDIVIPAMILHDVGWSQITREEWLVVFNVEAKQEEKTAVQLKHQSAGVELARHILNNVVYRKEMADEILEIISQHDTREGFISRNEGLVRDADKLWRSSKVGFEASSAKVKLTRDQRINRLEGDFKKPTFFYSKSAKQIADESIDLLRKLS